MSEYTFTEAGETYTVKGPNGLTFDQAQAIFKQQFSTGSLTGFKVGDALSAATQAADGLPSAQAALSQSLGSLTGALPSAANLNTISAGLGVNALAAAGQVQSSLQGQLPQLASLTTGASSAVNSAISGATSGLTGSVPVIGSSPVALTALTGQSAQLGSIANTTLQTLTKSIKGVPLQGIDIANFSKQLPALGSIGNLGQADVTGTLAQASKMVGQSFDKITNSLGAGKFGLDASQLERAGVVKPGTAAAFLQSGNNDLVSVLQSPTVWTGKDGIKGLDGLLKNPGMQDKIQQGLMGSGLNDLKQFGLPVDNLKPEALAGLATNAAKSVSATLDWAKGSASLPQIPTVPGGDVKSAFDAMTTNGAFAVKFATDKVEPALKQQEPVTPATDTVNAKTLDAAATRVVGNDKVPSVTPDGTTSAARTAVRAWVDFSSEQFEGLKNLEEKVMSLIGPGSITQQQWNTVNEEFQIIKSTYNSRVTGLQTTALEAINSVPEGENRANLVAAGQSAQRLAVLLKDKATRIKQFIADLANKIAT